MQNDWQRKKIWYRLTLLSRDIHLNGQFKRIECKIRNKDKYKEESLKKDIKVNKEENGQRSRNILQRNLTYSGQKKERRSSFDKKNWKARKQLIYLTLLT